MANAAIDPSKTTFLVIGPNVWGRGNSVEQALRNAKRQLSGSSIPASRRKFVCYEVDPGIRAWVHDIDGSVCWDIPAGMSREDGAKLVKRRFELIPEKLRAKVAQS